MKTQVEIFESTDVREETFEQSAEAKQLVESLGLMGQLPKAPVTVTARFPYRLMTDEEDFIYSQLTPQRTKLETYSGDPIPLEILKTVAYARSLQDSRIAYLEVWSASSAKVKDPILVGKELYYSSSNMYILGRWGEELLPLSVLLPDALKVWHNKRQNELNKIISKCKAALSDVIPLEIPDNVSIPYANGI